MKSHIFITTNETLLFIAFLTLLVAVLQLIYMRKQDKTNALLLKLSSRTSVVMCSGFAGSVGVMNVGQIDVYLEFSMIDSGPPIIYPEPIYIPPAGEDFFRQFDPDPSKKLAAGGHNIKIFLKDSLGRKWVLKGDVTKKENSKGVSDIITKDLRQHDYGEVPKL